MLFVCHSKILHKPCLNFLLGVKRAPRETENNAYAKFGMTNKEHYSMLWYFLELGQFSLLFILPFTKTKSSRQVIVYIFASALAYEVTSRRRNRIHKLNSSKGDRAGQFGQFVQFVALCKQ